MKLLDLTLPTAEENIALDEALLETAEQELGGEVLRIWAPQQPCVVIGRSSQIEQEVELDICRRRGIPVIRRSSGGLAIVTGPGCLMYSVVLDTQKQPELQSIDNAHCYVLQRILQAVRGLGVDAVCQGLSDLVVGDRKFSGNSLRCRRGHLLYHGTILNSFDLPLISKLLKVPHRQPEYRRQRPHQSFVMNLQLDGRELRNAIVHAWAPKATLDQWPEEMMRRFVAERYALDSWNARR